MSEIFRVEDILNDTSHPAYTDTKAMVEGLEAGTISMCGCIGPMYGEPYCACSMRNKSLQSEMDNNPLRIAEEKLSAERWAKIDWGKFES